MTEPVEQQGRQRATGRGAKEWLDTLAGGGCDLDTFVHGIGELLHRTPDSGWDLLALVDQYYRRGKISAESFGILKSHLQGLLVGKGQRGASSSVTAPPPVAPATRAATPEAAPPSGASTSTASPEPAAPTAATTSTPPAMPPAGSTASHLAASPPARPVAGARDLAPGDVLRGRYLVQEVLGQGGMGTVFAALDQYRVEQAQGEQRVALKVLHTDVIKRPRLFNELRREFQHLQSLSHPNIVRVHEFDQDGDLAFFTMEYLSGSMLSRVLTTRESVLPRPYALAITRDVGAAIAHAHSRGVVHGDLNPGNIFITQTGEVRVFDFGASHQLRRGPLVTELDEPGQVAVATPLYASCQVLEGAPATVSDDIYALACVAYLLLAGDHPFHDDNALKARSARLAPSRPPGLHGGQWRALEAGLQFEREKRPSDVQEWLSQLGVHAAAPHLPPLAALSTSRAPHTKEMSGWMKYAAATVIVALAGWWGSQHRDALMSGTNDAPSRVKSWFEAPALSGWLDRGRALGRKPDPVIDYPTDGDATAAPPEAAHRTDAPKPADEAHYEATATPPPVAAAAPALRTTVSAPTPAAARPAPVPAPNPATGSPGTEATTASAATAYAGPKAHLELTADTVEVLPTASVAHITVRRTRNTHGPVTFSWWTESGTALPGRDFTTVQSHVETMDNGQRAANLDIPVVANPDRQVPRNFYVVIDQAGDNAVVGPRTLTMVSLLGVN